MNVIKIRVIEITYKSLLSERVNIQYDIMCPYQGTNAL